MSAFGDFYNQPPQETDEDPAAEFLAREQDELAGLEDEVKPAAVVVPPVYNNGDEPANTNSASSFEMIDNNDQDEFKESKPNTDDFLFGYDPYEHDSVQQDFDSNYRDASPTPSIQKHEERIEPEKIRKWREEQIQRLEDKDNEEEKKKQELREIAKKELEDWYKNHEEAIAKTKAANRDAAKTAEKQFVAEDNELEPGTEWERIVKLCDFNPKAKQGSKDVSRMRSIVLQMKQNPVQIKNKS